MAVNYAASASAAEEVVARIKEMGGEAFAMQADVSKREDVEKLIAETATRFGRLDVLVNNAGAQALP